MFLAPGIGKVLAREQSKPHKIVYPCNIRVNKMTREPRC
jgi:hypothetical protein